MMSESSYNIIYTSYELICYNCPVCGRMIHVSCMHLYATCVVWIRIYLNDVCIWLPPNESKWYIFLNELLCTVDCAHRHTHKVNVVRIAFYAPDYWMMSYDTGINEAIWASYETCVWRAYDATAVCSLNDTVHLYDAIWYKVVWYLMTLNDLHMLLVSFLPDVQLGSYSSIWFWMMFVWYHMRFMQLREETTPFSGRNDPTPSTLRARRREFDRCASLGSVKEV